MDEQTIDFMSKVLKYNDSQVSTQLFYYLLFQLTNAKHKNKPKIKEDGVLKTLKMRYMSYTILYEVLMKDTILTKFSVDYGQIMMQHLNHFLESDRQILYHPKFFF